MNIVATEQILVASVLTNGAKPGPCLCTAIAYAPDYWESPEAGKLAQAIGRVFKRGFRASPPMVKAMCEPEYRAWLSHPTFGSHNALPLSCAEEEARVLIRHYQNQRILDTISDAYEQVIDHPEKALEVARGLHVALGEWCE